MSWQATAWAVKQRTGPTGCKLLLLTLANYADAGCCWKKPKPSPAELQMAFKESRKGVEVIQNQIVRKLGHAETRAGGRW